MAACGVADPKAVLRQHPKLLQYDHGSEAFLQFRLLLQRATGLTAAQLYEQHLLYRRYEPAELAQLAQWLLRSEQRGLSAQQRLHLMTEKYYPELWAAVGASHAEWKAWAADPPPACPLYGWVQQAAAEEAARLAAALPPELAL